MKDNILVIAFSVLLIVSSSLFSQPTDKFGISSIQNTLLLAKFNQNTAIDDSSTPDGTEPGIKNSLSDIRVDNSTASSIIATDRFSEEELAHFRKIFLEAEKAVSRNDETRYRELINQLTDYPLLPYLKYQWLKKNLDDEAEIKLFLSIYESSRYSRLLKNRWLFHLARNRQWPVFLKYYSTTNNTKLRCYYNRALFNTGDTETALLGAKELWSVGRSQPRVCDPLFKQLRKSDHYTQELVWQRFEKALLNNKISLAVYLKNQMPKSQHDSAQLWLDLHRRPDRHIQKVLKLDKSKLTASMFAHTIERLANKDITSAIRIWDANKKNYEIDDARVNKLEKKLAFKLVFKGKDGAYERFSQLSFPDTSSREWRVRVALSEQNWNNVLAAIDALSEEEKATEKWQYWQARALLKTGNIEHAENILSDLSTRRDFYGYLAADKMNSMYQLSDNPVQVSEQDIIRLRNHEQFLVAQELKALDRKNEAKLQWWHAVNQLDRQQIMTAAKLAQQWDWDEIAIFTIAKVKHWDDIEMRFPLSYAEKINENSAQYDLNPAIVFGLVRRESAFNENARSPTGARGLMQIMPGTGKHIARSLKERWRGSKSLDNPETNIRYGSYYYQKLLKKFDGNYALALAAYNAGSENVKRWLPESGSVPADIWIETIPFHETRDYVTAVLTYTLIYQQRAGTDELSMDDFTQEITPL